MRIVLDTNVMVSALISRQGPPGQVLAAIKREGHTLITSSFQIAEIREVLGRDILKPYIDRDEADDLLFNLEAVGVTVTDLPDMDLSPDPKDNPILATGVAGKANLIVSGDKGHLLALGEVEGIPIVGPRKAMNQLDSL